MKKVLFFLLMLCVSAVAQQKGEVFKTNPSYPQENINIAYITVTKTMYGLNFEDNTIKNKYKKPC